MSEEVHLQLQELPEQWNNTKKLAVTVKQSVAPLQVSAGWSVGAATFFNKMFKIFELSRSQLKVN